MSELLFWFLHSVASHAMANSKIVVLCARFNCINLTFMSENLIFIYSDTRTHTYTKSMVLFKLFVPQMQLNACYFKANQMCSAYIVNARGNFQMKNG